MGYNRQLTKKLEKCNHPNSRKTLALVKTLKKIKSRDKIKKQFAARVNITYKLNLVNIDLIYDPFVSV